MQSQLCFISAEKQGSALLAQDLQLPCPKQNLTLATGLAMADDHRNGDGVSAEWQLHNLWAKPRHVAHSHC